MSDTELEVTPVDQWQSPRKQGFLIELPSGNVARVKRTLDLVALVKSGQVPNPLGSVIKKMMDDGQQGFSLESMKEDPGLLTQTLELIDLIVVNAMVEPRVVLLPEVKEGEEPVDPATWQPPAGCIAIIDLAMEDRIFIVGVAQGGATDLSQFREQQAALVASISNGNGSKSAAKPVDRAKRPAKRK